MKKRIIAILLALSIIFTSFSFSKRVSADPSTVAIVGGICILAVSVLQFTTSGAYKDVAEDFVNIIEYTGEFVKYVFYGTDVINELTGEVIYHEDGPFLELVHSIADSLNIMYDKGELVYNDAEHSEKGSQYRIKGSHLKSMISDVNATIGAMARPNINFTAGYNCTFLDVDLSKPFTLKSLPTLPEFLPPPGESYAAIYFNANRVIFSQYHIVFFRDGLPDERGSTGFFTFIVKDDYRSNSYFFANLSPSSSGMTLPEFYEYCNVGIKFSGLQSAQFTWNNNIYEGTADHCFVYENGTVTYTPISEVDVTGMNSGLITTTGNYGDFLKSINDFSAGKTSVPALDNLDVVPDDSTVSIPANPDKDVTLSKQVGVIIPDVGDTTLSELQGDLNLDIDVPSIIVDKFPFCIPFDFVRFLGILCSDPVAPVFRIPISTHPDNLEQWEGNQTIGDYIDPDSPPLFEIDEEIVIDLSHIPLVQVISYTCFIVGFIFLLLHITPKMIQH